MFTCIQVSEMSVDARIWALRVHLHIYLDMCIYNSIGYYLDVAISGGSGLSSAQVFSRVESFHDDTHDT